MIDHAISFVRPFATFTTKDALASLLGSTNEAQPDGISLLQDAAFGTFVSPVNWDRLDGGTFEALVALSYTKPTLLGNIKDTCGAYMLCMVFYIQSNIELGGAPNNWSGALSILIRVGSVLGESALRHLQSYLEYLRNLSSEDPEIDLSSDLGNLSLATVHVMIANAIVSVPHLAVRIDGQALVRRAGDLENDAALFRDIWNDLGIGNAA